MLGVACTAAEAGVSIFKFAALAFGGITWPARSVRGRPLVIRAAVCVQADCFGSQVAPPLPANNSRPASAVNYACCEQHGQFTTRRQGEYVVLY